MEFDFTTSGEVVAGEFETRVPEQFRSAYVDGPDGKKVLNPAVKGLTDAITGLNGALRSERSTTRTLKGQKDVGAAVQEALNEFGITDLETAKTKIKELTESVAANSKVDPAKIRAEIEKAFDTERQGFTTKLGKMQGTLERYLVDSASTGALAEARGNVKLLLPIIKSQVKVVEDGEDYVVRVLDADGNYRGNGMGGFMSVADLVKELKSSKDYGVAFESQTPAGGGKPNGQPTSRQTQQRHVQQQQRENMSATDKIAAGLAAKRRGG